MSYYVIPENQFKYFINECSISKRTELFWIKLFKYVFKCKKENKGGHKMINIFYHTMRYINQRDLNYRMPSDNILSKAIENGTATLSFLSENVLIFVEEYRKRINTFYIRRKDGNGKRVELVLDIHHLTLDEIDTEIDHEQFMLERKLEAKISKSGSLFPKFYGTEHREEIIDECSYKERITILEYEIQRRKTLKQDELNVEMIANNKNISNDISRYIISFL